MARAKPKGKVEATQWKVKEEGEAAEARAQAEPPARQRIRETRFVGLITEWRGYMGWLQPLSKIEHDQASRHWGLLYVSQSDVTAVDGVVPWMRAGRIVDFYVYSDLEGLGAEEVRGLSPLRVTLSHGEAKTLLKTAGSPQWSEYLTDSEYYLNLTKGLGLVRKYSWQLPFVTFELWGLIEDVAREAVLLFSSQGGATDRRLALLLPEDQIAKVEHLPANPKVSTHAVVRTPPCRSLTLEASSEECTQAVVAFLKAMEGR
ncbi:unnamed protein product [Cladocopium goreaui]|uniref:Uncharacterized protein n=1 Tax=Cladocopium goreaui TaxID=2562237 RepID=A0A9P1GH86_9DINO|nr:unnamed protein product [Cladocopium goreaui]|mmetsp:Transcript_37288/g.80277  ORF Transcript_37288/g.80277 Transcript_37288/m.80277 type:complete len:260 (-) Transcript_37288:62-841(-)